MLDAIPNYPQRFLSTPPSPCSRNYSADEMIAFTKRNRDKITCINISRHLVKYVEESPDEVSGPHRLPHPHQLRAV